MASNGQAWRKGKRDAKKGEESGTFLLTKTIQTLIFFRDKLPLLYRSHTVSSSQFGTYPGHNLISHGSHVAGRGRMKPMCLASWLVKICSVR